MWHVVNDGNCGIRDVTIGCASILGFLLYILYVGGTLGSGIFLTAFSSLFSIVVTLGGAMISTFVRLCLGKS